MSARIVKFTLDEETGYPKLFPTEWSVDPRRLYAAARWLKKLLDSGSYIPALEYNDDEIFVISEEDNGFEMSVPNTATDEALHVLADMLLGMANTVWHIRFGDFHLRAMANRPGIIMPGPVGVAG